MNRPSDIRTDIAIVGGGLTGLALAARLYRAGRDFTLFEARPRFGGRIAAVPVPGGALDLGPAWFWPGQPRIAQLATDLGLRAFPQYAQGDGLLEDARGARHRGAGFASMAGAYRVQGGMRALIDGLAAGLPASRLHLSRPVIGVEPAGLRLADGGRCRAAQVVLAIPPRLAAALDHDPPLPATARAEMEAIPTWMAGHAKFVALYDRPFWREAGLSGDAMSQCGPLAEIHDASGHDGRPAALFGFLGVPAGDRQGRASEIEAAALVQLARLFGPAAGGPIKTAWQDWAADPFTATAADRVPPSGHPAYGPHKAFDGLHGGRLHLAVTETAPDAGGLLEGALAAAEAMDARIAAVLS
jgi:monoamine oxidase